MFLFHLIAVFNYLDCNLVVFSIIYLIFFLYFSLQTWPTKVISGYSLKNKQKLMTRSQLLTLLKDPNIQKTFAQKVLLLFFYIILLGFTHY